MTHLVHVASYLRHAHTRGRVDVLDTGSFLGAKRVSESAVRDHLDLPGLDVRVLPTVTPPTDPVYGTMVCVGAPATKALARLTLAHRGRRPHVVVVDEGIGTYGTVSTRRDALRRAGVPEPWRSVRASVVQGAGRLLTAERWALFEERAGEWHVHGAVAEEFRRRLVGAPARTPVAQYLTQPWVELGVMTEEEYAAHLAAVAAACATVGLAFEVRHHPAEDGTRYAAHPLGPTAVPAELDARTVHAAVVLGATSTALLGLAAIHGTPVVRVSNPRIDLLGRELGARQASLLDAFLPPPVTDVDLPRVLRGV